MPCASRSFSRFARALLYRAGPAYPPVLQATVSRFWFCREVIPFRREGIWFCLELKIWFRRYLFDFAVKVFGFTVSYLVVP